jgi:nicotinic acid mononucleotide adenylyltransferase
LQKTHDEDLKFIENLCKDHDKSSKVVEDLEWKRTEDSRTEKTLADRDEASKKKVSDINNKLELLLRNTRKL